MFSVPFNNSTLPTSMDFDARIYFRQTVTCHIFLGALSMAALQASTSLSITRCYKLEELTEQNNCHLSACHAANFRDHERNLKCKELKIILYAQGYRCAQRTMNRREARSSAVVSRPDNPLVFLMQRRPEVAAVNKRLMHQNCSS